MLATDISWGRCGASRRPQRLHEVRRESPLRRPRVEGATRRDVSRAGSRRLHSTYNFDWLVPGPVSVQKVSGIIRKALSSVPLEKLVFALGNHDVDRIVSRWAIGTCVSRRERHSVLPYRGAHSHVMSRGQAMRQRKSTWTARPKY